jgi:hypothetical protein
VTGVSGPLQMQKPELPAQVTVLFKTIRAIETFGTSPIGLLSCKNIAHAIRGKARHRGLENPRPILKGGRFRPLTHKQMLKRLPCIRQI